MRSTQMILKREVSKQLVVILNNAHTDLLQDSSVWSKFKGDYDFEDTLVDDEDFQFQFDDFDYYDDWGEEMEQLNDTTTPDPDPVLLLNDTLQYTAVEGIQIIVHKIKTTTWCHLNGPVGHLALLIDETCSGKILKETTMTKRTMHTISEVGIGIAAFIFAFFPTATIFLLLLLVIYLIVKRLRRWRRMDRAMELLAIS